MAKKSKREDLTGQAFNKWKVIEFDYTDKYLAELQTKEVQYRC